MVMQATNVQIVHSAKNPTFCLAGVLQQLQHSPYWFRTLFIYK